MSRLRELLFERGRPPSYPAPPLLSHPIYFLTSPSQGIIWHDNKRCARRACPSQACTILCSRSSKQQLSSRTDVLVSKYIFLILARGGSRGILNTPFFFVACLCMRADVIYIFNNLKTVINDGTHCSHDLNGYSTAARHD
jgi:hypothetical protein